MRLGFSQLLYNLDAATETLAIVVVALTLMGVIALASWLPARRAAGLNPVDALRTDQPGLILAKDSYTLPRQHNTF
jgi:ABC-type lipoprotein release transport system permease subunit